MSCIRTYGTSKSVRKDESPVPAVSVASPHVTIAPRHVANINYFNITTRGFASLKSYTAKLTPTKNGETSTTPRATPRQITTDTSKETIKPTVQKKSARV